MSTRKCGCVYADARNTRSVATGHEMGGYLKVRCATHTRQMAGPACLKAPAAEPDYKRERDALLAALIRVRTTDKAVQAARFDMKGGPDGYSESLRASEAADAAADAAIAAAEKGEGR